MQVQLEGFRKAKEALEAAKKEAAEKIGDALKELLEPTFKANPTLLGVRWAQYTPYFNDGDTCVFGVNEVRASISDVKNSDYEDGYSYLYGTETPIKTAVNELQHFLNEAEEILHSAFGDHAQITIDRELNVTVDEYEHD